MSIHQIYKQLVPADILTEVLNQVEADPDWVKDNGIAPLRLYTTIIKFPKIKEIVDKTFPELELKIENKIYFQKYPVGGVCKDHIDPSRITVVILIQEPDRGGFLSVEGTEAYLKAGDAIMFDGTDHHKMTPVLRGQRISLALWFK